MKIAICDDEYSIGLLLEKYMREWFSQKQLKQPEYAYYPSGEALIEAKSSFDIVFLDVRMDGISGIETGKKLKESNPHVIIFMETSYLEYLDDAMRFHVFRYLTKPIEKGRLFRNLDDAMKKYSWIQNETHRVEIKTQDEVYVLSAIDIVYVEARNHRTYVYTRDREYVTWESLENWSDQLGKDVFFRAHRSFLVNMKHVTNYTKRTLSLCDGKYTVDLSKGKYKEFSETYGELIKNVW